MADKAGAGTPTSNERLAEEPSRHVSIRLPVELYRRLEALSADGNESVSRTARRLLSDGLEPPHHRAIDQAISTLLLVRGHLRQQVEQAQEPAELRSAASPRALRTVDLFNAKTDLQHLIDDVARGDEIVITHAGARRARLVGVEPAALPDRPLRNR